jgi:hypothetical protein
MARSEPAVAAGGDTTYLRLTRPHFAPDRDQEVVDLTPAIAATQRLPGFRGRPRGLDPAGGTLVAVRLWDSAAHAGFEREALGPAPARAPALGVELEPAEVYAVVA